MKLPLTVGKPYVFTTKQIIRIEDVYDHYWLLVRRVMPKSIAVMEDCVCVAPVLSCEFEWMRAPERICLTGSITLLSIMGSGAVLATLSGRWAMLSGLLASAGRGAPPSRAYPTRRVIFFLRLPSPGGRPSSSTEAEEPTPCSNSHLVLQNMGMSLHIGPFNLESLSLAIIKLVVVRCRTRSGSLLIESIPLIVSGF